MVEISNISALMLVVGVALIQHSVYVSAKASWAHNDSDAWAREHPSCIGNKQSPINIDTKTVEYNPGLTPFKYSGLASGANLRGKLKNNGHTAQVDIEGVHYLEAGGLAGTYRTAQFHFHWGSHDVHGSEHTIDDTRFPLEMHIVNYAIKYDNISNAAVQPDGLAVLGILYRLSPYDNIYLNEVTQNLVNVKYADSEPVDIDSSHKLQALLPGNINEFYRYHGSLTTPGCHESVDWTIFHETVPISLSQLAEFRKLLSVPAGHASAANGTWTDLINNFRPIQPLNSRTVFTTLQTLRVDSSAATSSLERWALWTIITFLMSASIALRLES